MLPAPFLRSAARQATSIFMFAFQEIGADTILEDFDFPERDAFVSLYPQGYCNVDKQVRCHGIHYLTTTSSTPTVARSSACCSPCCRPED